MDSQITLPVETICHILLFLDPIDIVRLRVVSKQFLEITYGTTIWRTLYANARFPRPPAPLSCQTVAFCERTLVRSARLAKTWTTDTLQDVSCVKVQVEGMPTGSPKMVGGRWVLSCESSKQFLLHDVDAETSPPTLLYQFEGSIVSWDACSILSTAGELVYVAFCEENSRQTRSPWKLLEFRFDSDSDVFYHSACMDVPTTYFSESVHLICYRGPFLCVHYQRVVFDTRTRTFYEFPKFATKLSVTPTCLDPDLPTPYLVLFPNEYIIGLFPFMGPSRFMCTLIQAFTLPPNPEQTKDGTYFLRLTHEATIHNELVKFLELRQSLTDPVTGSTNVRFLQVHDERDARFFNCVDLTLPSPHPGPTTVLPISLRVHGIFKLTHGVYTPTHEVFVESSHDGYARGFSMTTDNARTSAMNDSMIAKFAIDATQDRCTAASSGFSKGKWQQIGGIPSTDLWFDGVRGRLCFRSGNGPHTDVTVVDVE